MPSIIMVSANTQRASTARMPYALREAGFNVWVVCPKNSILCKSDYIAGGRTYTHGASVGLLRKALGEVVVEASADAILPCDELAYNVLHLFKEEDDNEECRSFRDLLTGWVGDYSSVLRLRSKTVEFLQGKGIRTPKQVIFREDCDIISDLSQLGNPIVINSDHTCAGSGVAVVHTIEDAKRKANRIEKNPFFLLRDGMTVAQEFIAGSSASVSFSAQNGQTLEAFCYLIHHRYPEPYGPSSVVEIINRNDLLDITSKVVEHVAYTGFGGIDFILPEDGGEPVLLEVNPRLTQTTHLGGLFGADICRAMSSYLSGSSYQRAVDVKSTKKIALFPTEWMRDKSSPYLSSGYHDVPWSDRRVFASIVANTSQYLGL